MTGASKWRTSEEIVSLFQRVGRALLLIDAEDSHSGNISMRFTDDRGRERMAITATGSQKGDLEPSHICILSPAATDTGYYKASSETDVHASILALPGARASVHAHTKDLTIVTLDRDEKPSRPRPFVPIDPLGWHRFGGQVPVDWVEVPSGGTEMAKVIPERLAEHPVTMIQGHGAFARGRTVEEAFHLISVANHAGYVVRQAERIGLDVAGIRARIAADLAAHFAHPPDPFTIGDDEVCEFPLEKEIVREFRKAGARIFESRLSPYHTGSLSVRGIRSLLYAPKAAMPRELPGPLREIPLAPDPADSRELAIHKAIYAAGNFQTIAHCWVPEAEVAAWHAPAGGELPTRLVPIDAEGSFLYLVVPILPPDAPVGRLADLLHDYKVAIVRGGGVWGAGMQSLSEVLHHPSSVREICLYRFGAVERGLDLAKLEPAKARTW
ncbi:MAG: class II aldolase/adducin family protein [Planctomycetota bacterium]